MNYVNYSNKDGLKYALLELEEFVWMQEKYQDIFINETWHYNNIKNILGYVPSNWDELFTVMKQNREILKYIENLFYKVYTMDDSVTLLADVTGMKLYVARGCIFNSDAQIINLKDIYKIYNLNPECEDYEDIFGHRIRFFIENEFIRGAK